MSNKRSIVDALANVVGLIVIMWLFELINMALHHRLCDWGIIPRTTIGLAGILLAPFVHFGIGHILTNTPPLTFLGSMIALSDSRRFNKVTVFVILTGGLGVWLFARPASHVGASGLIFGYFGFLVFRGWYDRRFGSLVLALVVIFFYGGMIWGILPLQPYVSWEAHLFGFIAGALAARILKFPA